MGLPGLIITGASGFLGRHLLAALKDKYRIFALARRSQRRVRVPVHPNILWYQADVGDMESLSAVFRSVRELGGAQLMVHLAAHYDFTGDNHPEYWRTNVQGLRNVLELCEPLRLSRFVFASSVAACSFPPPGSALTESSPLDGDHIYAETKRLGEAMLAEYRERFPVCAVRLAAIFSDWCEYPVLFSFLGTWLGPTWFRRVLAGKGESAVPYLHIRDAVAFFARLLERHAQLPDAEVLIASPDGAVSHRSLFDAATRSYFGRSPGPLLVPRALCRLGLHGRDAVGRILGERPFERPWMGRYIDLRLTVDARRSRELLGWAPNPRLRIERRMPFLVDNFKTDPVEWRKRNWAALKTVEMSRNLRVYRLLEANAEDIIAGSLRQFMGRDALSRFPGYLALDVEELDWAVSQALRHLTNAVRAKEKLLFRSYCRDLARRRHALGFPREEVCGALAGVMESCLEALRMDPEGRGLEEDVHDLVEMTFRLGIDEVEDAYEELSGAFVASEEGATDWL